MSVPSLTHPKSGYPCYFSKNPGSQLASKAEFSLPNLSNAEQRELADILQTNHAPFLQEDLVRFANRLEKSDKFEAAALLYQCLLQDEAVPREFQEKAKERLQIMEGRGPSGSKVEFFLKRILKDAADPKYFVAMTVASAAGLLARGLMLKRMADFTKLAKPSMIRTSWVRSTLAMGAEIGTQIPAFVGTAHLYDRFFHPSQAKSLSLQEELASSAVMLGALKFFLHGGDLLFRRIHAMKSIDSLFATERALSWSKRMTRTAFAAGGTILGVHTAHSLQRQLGFLPPQEDWRDSWFDDAAGAIQLGLGTLLGHRLGGWRLGRWRAELKRFENLRTESSIDGPFGKFIRTDWGVSVYSPLPSPGVGSPRGTVLLISGAGGNYTSFGNIPGLLQRQGYRVETLVFPGYENPRDPAPLRGGGFKGSRVAELWRMSMNQAVADLVQSHRQGPLFLGGFSMGGAGALLTYEALPLDARAKVSGFILAAPAIHLRAFDGPNPAVNKIARHAVLPTLAFLGKELQKTETGIHSDLGPHIEVAMRVPRNTQYAAVKLIEQGRAAMGRLAKSGDIPPTLLIHSGKGDPTVSERSATLLKKRFGNRIWQETQIPERDGHYVLVGNHRNVAEQAILDFVSNKGHRKMPSTEKLELLTP